MKKCTALVFLIFITVASQAQYKGGSLSTNFNYSPASGENGIDLSILFNCTYSVYVSDPYHSVRASITKGNTIRYNGQQYSREEVGAKVWESINPLVVYFEVDLYDGPDLILTDRFDMPISGINPYGTDSWNTILPNITAERAKELFKRGFRVANVRIYKIGFSSFYDLQNFIDNKKKSENYKNKITEAERQLNSNNLEGALKAFSEAGNIMPGEPYPKEKISEIKILMANQVRQEELNKKATQDKNNSESDKETSGKKEETASTVKKDESPEEEKSESGDSLNYSGGTGLFNDESLKRQAEYERMQRFYLYNTQKMETMKANADAATGAAVSVGALMTAVGGALFSNIKNDNPYEIFKGNSWRICPSLGFAFTSAPIFHNSDWNFYDGNSYINTKETISQQTFTFDLQGGLELWPLYGENAGVGMFAGLSGGAFIENMRFGYEYGVKGFYGVPAFKMFIEFSKGYRLFKYDPTINPDEFGSGKSQYTYNRISVGPMITWNGYFIDDTRINLSLLPIFELPDRRILNNSNKPLINNFFNGISLNLHAENVMRIFADIFWSYLRTGDIEYPIDSEMKTHTLFIRGGVIRTFDFFGNSSYKYDFDEVKKLCSVKNRTFLLLGMPSVSWIHQEQDTTFFISDFKTGISPLGIEYDFRISSNFSVYIGGSFTIGSGAILRALEGENLSFNKSNYNSDQNVKLNLAVIKLPVGIRFHPLPGGKNLFWLKSGVSNDLNFPIEFAVKSDLWKGKYESVDLAKNYLKLYIPSFELGLGLDFPVDGYIMFRTGIVYTTGITKMTQDTNQSLKMRSISLNIGIEL